LCIVDDDALDPDQEDVVRDASDLTELYSHMQWYHFTVTDPVEGRRPSSSSPIDARVFSTNLSACEMRLESDQD
jgi:hypothetical protein